MKFFIADKKICCVVKINYAMKFFIADKKICFVVKMNYAMEHIICCNYSGFLPGIFSGGGKIYCYANFSIVF